MLIAEEERAKEPPSEHPLSILSSRSRSCFTVPSARPTELDRSGGDGGRNEEATGGGAGQSVGQPVGLSFPALSAPRFARAAWSVNDTSSSASLFRTRERVGDWCPRDDVNLSTGPAPSDGVLLQASFAGIDHLRLSLIAERHG